MRPYIDFNTQKRTISNNEADNNFFKSRNNSVYDKTMENLRKRIKIRVVKTLLNIHENLHALIENYLKTI